MHCWSCGGITSARLFPCLFTYHPSLSNRRPCGASPPQPPLPSPPLPSPAAAPRSSLSLPLPGRAAAAPAAGAGEAEAGAGRGTRGARRGPGGDPVATRWRWRRRAPCGAVRPRCVFQVRFPSGFFDESEAAAGARSRG